MGGGDGHGGGGVKWRQLYLNNNTKIQKNYRLKHKALDRGGESCERQPCLVLDKKLQERPSHVSDAGFVLSACGPAVPEQGLTHSSPFL